MRFALFKDFGLGIIDQAKILGQALWIWKKNFGLGKSWVRQSYPGLGKTQILGQAKKNTVNVFELNENLILNNMKYMHFWRLEICRDLRQIEQFIEFGPYIFPS